MKDILIYNDSTQLIIITFYIDSLGEPMPKLYFHSAVFNKLNKLEIVGLKYIIDIWDLKGHMMVYQKEMAERYIRKGIEEIAFKTKREVKFNEDKMLLPGIDKMLQFIADIPTIGALKS